MDEVTLSVVQIELTWSLFWQCALSLQRLLPLSLGEYQAYKTYYLYFKKSPRSYKWPYQVEFIQGGFTSKETFLRASIFQFSATGSH